MMKENYKVKLPNIDFMMNMTKDFLDGKIDGISYSLDFPYELEKRYKKMKKEDDDYFPEIFEWKDETEEIDNALIAQDWLNIKHTMWNYVGLVRTKARLHRAQQIFRHLSTEIEDFYRKAKMTKEIIQLRNGVTTAYAITNFAIEDRTSRGCHYIKK